MSTVDMCNRRAKANRRIGLWQRGAHQRESNMIALNGKKILLLALEP
jgi:hypothetical protein